MGFNSAFKGLNINPRIIQAVKQKGPVSTATKAVGSPQLFKAAGWRLYLLGYAHHVTAGASQAYFGAAAMLSDYRMVKHHDDARCFVIQRHCIKHTQQSNCVY